MEVDVLVAEIGSTTTVVNGFMINNEIAFIGSGQAPTSIEQGDVNVGLSEAIDDFKTNLGITNLSYGELMATSSAAGGLKMTVHGLVYEMTVKAAKEAALGAGANIHMITSGKLRSSDIEELMAIKPNIILIAGGVDFGERDTAIENAKLIASLNLDTPVIYAGNIQNHKEIKKIFEDTDKSLYIVENVYPSIDQLNVEPTRKVIQDVFEEHIVHAAGMAQVREMVTGNIIPTPAGVMEATKVISEMLGDVVTIDVGGATTDIHSVTEGNEAISKIMISPEPKAKRTVEGDLGVYVNFKNIVDMVSKEVINKKLKISESKLLELITHHKPIPVTDLEIEFVELLTFVACETALDRHVGSLLDLFSASGRKRIAQGKDLTSVEYIIGTGGALTRLPHRVKILEEVISMNNGLKLLPNEDAKILIDNDYILASLGVLSHSHMEASLALLQQTFNIK